MLALAQGTMITTTTFGSWLPGDVRGYVEDGNVLPSEPRLESFAKAQMRGEVVVLDNTEQDLLFDSLVAAAAEFGYRLSDVVIEATHAHWIIGHDDSVEAMVGRLKTRMRQALARGRLWTAGYCGRGLTTLSQLQTAREYLSRHPGVRMMAGQILPRPSAPGSAGG